MEGAQHLRNISDTARWVAYYRALESDRPDAIFRDPYARRLAGDRGEAIARTMKREGEMASAMIVRTAVLDEVILDRVRFGGVDLVLNLAAGLDTRPWRIDRLPPALRWVDVDLPDMLDYKLETLAGEATVCAYETVPLDLTDAAKRRALFEQIGASASRVLVVTEGLLVYLTESDVGGLARDLHVPRSFEYWLFDLISRRLLTMIMRTWGSQLSAANAPFRFAPVEGTKFFEAFGWRELEYRSAIEEGQRLRREMPRTWLWKVLAPLLPKKRRADFRRMSGFVVLERM